MKTTVIVALMASFFGAQSWAVDPIRIEEGEPPDHLVPIPPECDAYRSLLNEKLSLETGHYRNYGCMVYRPSFKGEFAVTVCAELGPEIPAEIHAYHIRLVRANQNIWYSMPGHGDELKIQDLKISTKDVSIDKDFAIAVQRAWATILLKTQYPSRGSNRLRDGNTAEFSVAVENTGGLYGETLSPHDGLMKKLVDLGIGLADFCDAKPEERPSIEKTMLQRLVELRKLGVRN